MTNIIRGLIAAVHYFPLTRKKPLFSAWKQILDVYTRAHVRLGEAYDVLCNR